MDGLAEDSRARRPRRRTAVLPAVVAATSVWVVTSDEPVIVVAPSPADHVVVLLRLASVAEAFVDRGGPEAIVHRGPLRDVLTSPRRGALGLLYCGGLEKVLELAADPSPLRGRGLRHRSDQYHRRSDVLASAIEDRGLLAPFIIVNAAVDVASPQPGRSAIIAPPLLLLEGGSELLQEESILLDLGLKLTEPL